MTNATLRFGLTVAVTTLGCKVNRVESDGIAAELLGRGVRVVEADSADVVVVNTCTVTAEADAKARKAVRQALKAPGKPVVVVTGCLAALDGASLEALGDRVVVEPDKETVAAKVIETLRVREPANVTASPAPTPVTRGGAGFRTRVPVKVQDGCDSFCTYCVVPYARGVPRSRPAVDVVDEVRALANAGVREVVLTGVNAAKYHDPEFPQLAWLAAEIAGRTAIERIRVSSLELEGLCYFLQATSYTPKIVRHFHVPLQSGSDRVLAAMGRTYTAEQYRTILCGLRSIATGMTYTTDVICGFPGETEEDHRATMAFCEEIGFSRLHVFRYSRRDGTPAAAMPDQLPARVKARRAADLRELDATLRGRFIESRLGQTVEVLVERVEDGVAEGTTREYLRVRAPAAGASVGELVTVELTREMVVDCR